MNSSAKATERPSRREALRGGVSAVATALAVSTGAGRVAAQPVDPDVVLLNALLATEYNALAAYAAGAGILSSPPMGDPLAAIAPTALAVAGQFLEHHREHARELRAAVTRLGGTPIGENSGMFAPPRGFTPSVLNVLRLAANAEKGAAIVYAEALKSARDGVAASLLASIGNVEAQHYEVLQLLARGVIAGTEATASMAADVVPRAFVEGPTRGVMNGLDTLPELAFQEGGA